MDSTANPTIAALLPPSQTSPEESPPEQSLEDSFSDTNAALASITAKILAHGDALPGPGETADPEALKTSASVVRILETSIRALKRVQDIRIAQEKFLDLRSSRQKMDQEKPACDGQQIMQDYIATLQKAREWRRGARAQEKGLSSQAEPYSPEPVSSPYAPAPELDAPETAEIHQVLPAAMVEGSSSTEGSSLSTATYQCAEPLADQPASSGTDLWTPGSLADSAPDSEFRSPDSPPPSTDTDLWTTQTARGF